MTASILRAREPNGDASLDRPADLADRLGHHVESALDRVRGQPRRRGLGRPVGTALILGLAAAVALAALAMSWARAGARRRIRMPSRASTA